MELALLDKKKELPQWLPEWVNKEDLPGHTFVALENGNAIAIAALRLCEGTICLLDSMATDPMAPRKARHIALDLLVDRIKAKAMELGYKYILATTRESSILDRANTHGFNVLSEFNVIVKEL